MSLSPAEVLNDAAKLASRQPTVTSAIREALKFADRYAPGACVLADCGEDVSVALVLPGRCARPADVAEVFSRAAGAVA